MTGLRVLMLTPELPERSGTGGARRCWEQVIGLRALGHTVTVASVARADQAGGVALLHERGVQTIIPVRPEPQWREAALGSLRAPRTLGVLLTESFHRWQMAIFAAQLRRPLAAWLAEHEVDVALIVHDFAMVEFARLLPPGIPTVGDFQNITANLHAKGASTSEGWTRRYQAREAARQAKDLERLPASMVATSACSPTEAAEISARTGLDCAVVPNGADVDVLAAIPIAGGEPDALLFSGSLGYPPNAAGARWLATDVLPLVQAQVPGAHLTIVGRGAPAWLQQLAAPDVRLTGFVPELEPVLAGAQVYVAGLLSGAGTKLKVIEALAAGRPLVATSVAAEGLDLRHEEHALIADGAPAFAAAIVRLLGDPALARSLAKAGRAHAAAHFSWTAAIAKQDAQLRALALDSPPQPATPLR